MARRCRLCTHPKRAELERLYFEGARQVDVAARASDLLPEGTPPISRDVVQRHFNKHVEERPDLPGGAAWRALGQSHNGAQKQRFIEALLTSENFGLSQAARAAGYSARSSASTATALLKNPKVCAALAERIRERYERVEIEADDVVYRLSALAFADLRNIAVWGGDTVELIDSGELEAREVAAIAEVSSGQFGPKVKMHNPARALEKLMAHLGMTTHRHEATVTIEHVQGMGQVVREALKLIPDETIRQRVLDEIAEGWRRLG